MSEQFTHQLTVALEGVRTALGPSVRFVRAEHNRAERFTTSLGALQERLRALRHDIADGSPMLGRGGGDGAE
jgi:hypothetical protein